MNARLARRESGLRVALLADAGFYRDALARVLPRWGLAVVDRDAAPDLILVDVKGSGGVNVLRELAATSPDTRFLAIGVRDDDSDVLHCIEAGAIGYVLENATLEELADSVHHAVRDEPLASPRVIATLMRRVASLTANGRRGTAGELTSRELEVVELIERGLSNKEIATQLSITVATVKNHVHSILEKLHVHRRG